jgi:pyruvate,water dikinase
MGIWVVDNEPSRRYPLYTRGNVGEVFPEAVAPLTWTMSGVPEAEPGWRDALVRFGAFDPDEFDPDQIEIMGVFGGYCYLNVSVYRVFAVRTPGLTPELMDQTLFGAQPVPPYEGRPGDESPEHTERIQGTVQWIMTTDDLPDLVDDQRRVEELIAARPDFSTMSTRELVHSNRALIRGHLRHLFSQHLFITTCATVPVGAIATICTELGDPTLAMRLVGGIGGVDSAAPSWALWELSREVARSPELMAAFDAGVSGVYDRLEPKFRRRFDEFLDEFGCRGPNEWEVRSPTWGTDPELALTAVDRMRHTPDNAAPQRHFDGMVAEREQLTAQVAEQLAGNPEVQGQFLAAVRAAQLFLAGRERTKTTVIRFAHEARLRAHEIGRRMVAEGHFERVEDFGMLRDDEFDALLDDPGSFRSVLAERTELYERLQALEPPFIVNGTVPPIEEWRPRGSTPVEVARPGDVLTGIPGCPGSHTGRARVVLRPDDPRDLAPGEVLVAPITDPAWTPLFVPAGAVIVDVGAQISHAVIVSRELGIPCVVSVTDGTRRIPDGAQVTVDGTSGTVTVH